MAYNCSGSRVCRVIREPCSKCNASLERFKGKDWSCDPGQATTFERRRRGDPKRVFGGLDIRSYEKEMLQTPATSKWPPRYVCYGSSWHTNNLSNSTLALPIIEDRKSLSRGRIYYANRNEISILRKLRHLYLWIISDRKLTVLWSGICMIRDAEKIRLRVNMSGMTVLDSICLQEVLQLWMIRSISLSQCSPALNYLGRNQCIIH